MKVTPDQRAKLAAAIARWDTEESRDNYRAGRFEPPNAGDLDKRYRWDLVEASGAWRIVCRLYEAGLNGSHIDTALRSIVAPL